MDSFLADRLGLGRLAITTGTGGEMIIGRRSRGGAGGGAGGGGRGAGAVRHAWSGPGVAVIS